MRFLCLQSIFIALVSGSIIDDCVSRNPISLLGKCKRIPRFRVLTKDVRIGFQLHVGNYRDYTKPVGVNFAIGRCGHKFYMVPTFDQLVHSTFLSRDENQTIIIADETINPIDILFQNNTLSVFGDEKNYTNYCDAGIIDCKNGEQAIELEWELDESINSLKIVVKNAQMAPLPPSALKHTPRETTRNEPKQQDHLNCYSMEHDDTPSSAIVNLTQSCAYCIFSLHLLLALF